MWGIFCSFTKLSINLKYFLDLRCNLLSPSKLLAKLPPALSSTKSNPIGHQCHIDDGYAKQGYHWISSTKHLPWPIFLFNSEYPWLWTSSELWCFHLAEAHSIISVQFLQGKFEPISLIVACESSIALSDSPQGCDGSGCLLWVMLSAFPPASPHAPSRVLCFHKPNCISPCSALAWHLFLPDKPLFLRSQFHFTGSLSLTSLLISIPHLWRNGKYGVMTSENKTKSPSLHPFRPHISTKELVALNCTVRASAHSCLK